MVSSDVPSPLQERGFIELSPLRQTPQHLNR
jgi:hypothetical protein